MDIPRRLIPCRFYKNIEIENLASEKNNFFLMRRGNNVPILDDNGDANLKFIYENPGHVKNGLSCWLIGWMKIEDAKIEPENNEDWVRCGERTKNKNLIANINNETKVMFFKVRDIHGVHIPYEDEKRRKIEPDAQMLGSRKERAKYREYISRRFEGVCKLFHKPTKSNFWHFEFHFFDSEGQKVEEIRLIKSIANSFLKNAIITKRPKKFDFLYITEFCGLPCWFEKSVKRLHV
jgi:hypothetical protein